MEPARFETLPHEKEVRMGSEYATAADYLARPPRTRSVDAASRKSKDVPQHGKSKDVPEHGINDSDFGFADQRAEPGDR